MLQNRTTLFVDNIRDILVQRFRSKLAGSKKDKQKRQIRGKADSDW